MKTTGVSSIPKFGLLDFLGHPNIQDNAGGGEFGGEFGKSGKHWKSEYKGEVRGAAVLSVRGEWLCSLCDIYVCGSGQYKVQCFKYTLCIYTYKWFVLCV